MVPPLTVNFFRSKPFLFTFVIIWPSISGRVPASCAVCKNSYFLPSSPLKRYKGLATGKRQEEGSAAEEVKNARIYHENYVRIKISSMPSRHSVGAGLL
jgi:hypothetical protein